MYKAELEAAFSQVREYLFIYNYAILAFVIFVFGNIHTKCFFLVDLQLINFSDELFFSIMYFVYEVYISKNNIKIAKCLLIVDSRNPCICMYFILD